MQLPIHRVQQVHQVIRLRPQLVRQMHRALSRCLLAVTSKNTQTTTKKKQKAGAETASEASGAAWKGTSQPVGESAAAAAAAVTGVPAAPAQVAAASLPAVPVPAMDVPAMATTAAAASATASEIAADLAQATELGSTYAYNPGEAWILLDSDEEDDATTGLEHRRRRTRSEDGDVKEEPDPNTFWEREVAKAKATQAAVGIRLDGTWLVQLALSGESYSGPFTQDGTDIITGDGSRVSMGSAEGAATLLTKMMQAETGCTYKSGGTGGTGAQPAAGTGGTEAAAPVLAPVSTDNLLHTVDLDSNSSGEVERRTHRPDVEEAAVTATGPEAQAAAATAVQAAATTGELHNYGFNIHIYIYVDVYISIYIYIEREICLWVLVGCGRKNNKCAVRQLQCVQCELIVVPEMAHT